MADPNYLSYQYICKNLNQDNINNFKRIREIIGIIENVNLEFGNQYLKNIINYPEIKNINWDNIKNFNDIGNPDMHRFLINNKEINLSPTTLRYIQYSLDMLYYIKNNLNISNVHIFEVGGGYGFQCILLFELAKLFSINVDSYTIIDLNEANNMQYQYISKCRNYFSYDFFEKINFMAFDNIHDIPKLDNSFFISNYALGEFNKNIQDFYMDNVVSRMKHGYICWNFSVGNPTIHSYILNIKPTIEEENPQTNCPPIKSYIIKF
jgi:hypothetical protein